MNLACRVRKMEAATVRAAKYRRLMELITLGTLRGQGRTSARPLSLYSEGELLAIIGADKAGYDEAVQGFAEWYRRERLNDEPQGQC